MARRSIPRLSRDHVVKWNGTHVATTSRCSRKPDNPASGLTLKPRSGSVRAGKSPLPASNSGTTPWRAEKRFPISSASQLSKIMEGAFEDAARDFAGWMQGYHDDSLSLAKDAQCKRNLWRIPQCSKAHARRSVAHSKGSIGNAIFRDRLRAATGWPGWAQVAPWFPDVPIWHCFGTGWWRGASCRAVGWA